jgi:hypothetical protein
MLASLSVVVAKKRPPSLVSSEGGMALNVEWCEGEEHSEEGVCPPHCPSPGLSY